MIWDPKIYEGIVFPYALNVLGDSAVFKLIGKSVVKDREKAGIKEACLEKQKALWT